MKTLLRCLTSALLLVAAVPAWAGATYLKATVSGTVQTQIILSATNGRIHTTQLNNKRIFEEFQVSTQDYELCCSVDSNDGLVLMPKHSSAALPKIEVGAIDTLDAVVDTKVQAFKIQAGIAKGTATNLFQNVAGEYAGTINYQGGISTLDIRKIVLSANARGTDTSSNGSALLKFKIVAQGKFVQQP